MGTSPLPDPTRTPPLGGTVCPDPRWGGQRAVVLQGPQGMLGGLWVLELGEPAGGPLLPTPPPPPPVYLGPEGSIPYVDDPTTP